MKKPGTIHKVSEGYILCSNDNPEKGISRWIIDFRPKMNGFIHECSDTYSDTKTIIAASYDLPNVQLIPTSEFEKVIEIIIKERAKQLEDIGFVLKCTKSSAYYKKGNIKVTASLIAFGDTKSWNEFVEEIKNKILRSGRAL